MGRLRQSEREIPRFRHLQSTCTQLSPSFISPIRLCAFRSFEFEYHIRGVPYGGKDEDENGEDRTR